MERGISEKNVLDQFCEDFCAMVQKHAMYIVVSGFVAISSGRVRATEDIDLIVEKMDEEKWGEVHADLLNGGFVCMQSDDPKEIYSYFVENLSVRYVRENQPLPEMEVKFVQDALDEYQMQTREKLPLTGLDIWFSSVNMNIAFKEEYLKSEKDMEDAQHLRKAFKEKVDEMEINKIKAMIRRYRLGKG